MCYCSSKVDFAVCCEPYLLGKVKAPTPEALMRSRYCAYVVANVQYIANTYAAEQRKHNSLEGILAFAQSCKFVKLEIIDSNESQVEFKAHYIQDGYHQILHERSNFVSEEQSWLYKDGHLFETQSKALARNALCPCGSGKKFKRCHG